MNKILESYTNPKIPGSFSGISGFLRNNSHFKHNKNVRELLQSSPVYTLHKPIAYKFNRNKTLVPTYNHQWQIDLVDMTKYAGSNSNIKFIFTCIDVFNKVAWAVPMLSKSSDNCKKAFEIIINEGNRPIYLYSDAGNEFKGEFQKYLNQLNIKLILTTTKNKASVVERFNRTLKEKLFRYFQFNKKNKNNLYKNRYLDVLQDIVNSYNNSWHRSIKMAPNQVNKKNENQVFYNLYGFYKENGDDRIIKLKFKKGTYVRIVKDKSIFEKGYTSKWSDKIYIINKIILSVPPLYELNEINKNNEIKETIGQYYAEELQKVNLPYDCYEIIEENDNNIIARQLNTSDPQDEIIDKKDYIANRLRSRK
jgi:hypothetical protein